MPAGGTKTMKHDPATFKSAEDLLNAIWSGYAFSTGNKIRRRQEEYLCQLFKELGGFHAMTNLFYRSL